MHTSFLTAAAALAASAIATPIESRDVLATWTATDVSSNVNHFLSGVKFHLTAPAGYVAGAPAFDVNCEVDWILNPGVQPCTANGELADGSKVEASIETSEVVTVYHTFGSQKATGASAPLTDGNLNADFTLDVSGVGSA
ncbi:hypothetical protein EKO27_g318 [Xylaria grammica]|uniref:AA1-like domain-containing protein n=1 Tax=Xylaria grammica TaxID=363999 RepID=A0A439DK94_9PEZI|nr:hypothetical protein EKO27_g318 [Xylaria grammica]